MQPVVQVDAFTDRAFGGNPAAVCLLDEALDADLMQAIAGEMNLAETAFLQVRPDGWDLRWFTPTVEVDLCGHATLASAHALWESGHAAPDSVLRFHTRSGLLTAAQRGDWIELDFPALGSTEVRVPSWLESALGARPVQFLRGPFDYLVELASEAAVRALEPDLRRLAAEPVRGFIVTAPGSGEFDFVSRYFCPAAGISEDPVTGSAHCALAPFWAPHTGKLDMVAYQASRRGGVVRMTLDGDRVRLGGQAVTTLRGELVL
jgi:predicted PhzF superfamily epimerase YddE/YHI9